MHFPLPLLVLSLLGVLTLPITSLAQQGPNLTTADSSVATLSAPAIAIAPASVTTIAPAEQPAMLDSILEATPQLPSSAIAVAAPSDAETATTPEQPASVVATDTEPATEPIVAKVLSGNVVDEWGNPLAGATVTVLGKQPQAVSTNADGNYVLPATKEVALVVRVSFGGYHDAERVARSPADTLFMLEPITDYRRDLKKRGKTAVKAWKK